MPTTIAVAGFPVGTTTRELRNLCRLCPGFEAASPNQRHGKPPTLFVKFVSEESASDAIFHLQAFCFDQDIDAAATLKAEFARNEMTPHLMHHNGHGPKDDGGPHAKRPRIVEPVAQASSWGVDTLACKCGEDTMHAEQLLQFFEQLPGFMAFKENPQSSNCFVKFSTPSDAKHALHVARSEGLSVNFAKRNLEESDVVQAGPGYAPVVPVAPAIVPGSGVKTLACKIEHDQESYQQFFEQLQGFESLKFSAQGTNCFVKFSTPGWAQKGLSGARKNGFTIDFAKRDDGDFKTHAAVPHVVPPAGAFVPLAAPAPIGGAISTLACKLEGTSDQDAMWNFFGSLPGFENLKVASSGSNCFVKFADRSLANNAMITARQSGLTVDFAKRELDEGMAQPEAYQQNYVAHGGAAPSIPASGSGGKTLACKMETDSEDTVRSYFGVMAGFESLKIASSGRVCFIKFADNQYATEALNLARVDGFTLDFAKRELEEGSADWGSSAPAPPPQAVVGVSSLAIKMEGTTEPEVTEFFQALPGYESYMIIRSGRCSFVKFTDPDSAQAGLDEGKRAGFTVEFAKRD